MSINLDNIFPVIQVFNNATGGLPITSPSFKTDGGTLLIFANGSGFRSGTSGIMGMNIQVDGINKGVTKVFTNTVSSHKSFISNIIIATGIPVGDHTITLTALANTLTDFNDFYTIYILELPN